MARVTVELYGVPRLRAGCGAIELDASSARDALRQLTLACPALNNSVVRGDWLHSAYRLSLNGARFLDDPATVLSDGDTLLLIAADAGG